MLSKHVMPICIHGRAWQHGPLQDYSKKTKQKKKKKTLLLLQTVNTVNENVTKLRTSFNHQMHRCNTSVSSS